MRKVIHTIGARAGSDGDGVKLYRSLGGPELPELNPFLLLDEFGSDEASDYVGGFPNHPHRGFETVTIMKAGYMRHGDSAGHEGVIGPGDIQWMTAGSGIIHSEMPEQAEGRLAGFQLWVNLPASHKMHPPRYQDISSDKIPVVTTESAAVRVIAGHYRGVAGAAKEIVTRPTVLDMALSGELQLPVEGRALLYVYEGQLTVGGDQTVGQRQLALLNDEGDLLLAGEGKALLLAAQPLNEPVARYGPFVMNSREELLQAFEDYQNGTLVKDSPQGP